MTTPPTGATAGELPAAAPDDERRVTTTAVGVVNAFRTLPPDAAHRAAHGLVSDLVGDAGDVEQGRLIAALYCALAMLGASTLDMLDTVMPGAGGDVLRQLGEGAACP